MPKKKLDKTAKIGENEEIKTENSEKITQEKFEKMVLDLAKTGLTAEKIGENLRKQKIHPKEYGKKISKILIDLKKVNYIDSSGLAAFVELLQMTKSYDGKIVLCNLNDGVKNVFHISKLDFIFPLAPPRAQSRCADFAFGFISQKRNRRGKLGDVQHRRWRVWINFIRAAFCARRVAPARHRSGTRALAFQLRLGRRQLGVRPHGQSFGLSQSRRARRGVDDGRICLSQHPGHKFDTARSFPGLRDCRLRHGHDHHGDYGLGAKQRDAAGTRCGHGFDHFLARIGRGHRHRRLRRAARSASGQ